MNIKEILFGNETEEEQAAAQTAVKEKEADTDEVTTDMLIVDII